MSTNEEHLSPTEEKATVLSPGKYLRQVREEKGLSIEVVAEATKISIKNIRAIEEENYEVLPADTFVRGLVNLYCNFLALDGSIIAADFLAERENSSPGTSRRIRAKKHLHSSSLAPKKLAEPAHISSATVALVLLAVIIFSFTGFSLYTSWNPLSFFSKQTENIQTSMHQVFNQEEQEGATVASEDSPLPEMDTESTTASKHDSLYALSAFFLQDSQIEITIDGQGSRLETYKNGQMADWNVTSSLQIIFDKPSAAILKLNDKPLPFPEPDTQGHSTLRLPDDLPGQ